MPTENETTLSCEAPCSVLTLSNDKQRRGGGSPWKDILKGMWGSMVKWLKARDGGWKRTLASVNRLSFTWYSIKCQHNITLHKFGCGVGAAIMPSSSRPAIHVQIFVD